MSLLCRSVLKNTRLSSCFTHLPRNFLLCKQAECPANETCLVSHIKFKTTAQLRATAKGPPYLFCGSGRTACLNYGVKPTLPAPCTPALIQCIHHFHTSAPTRALPAPLIWIVLKPLQKLAALLLGRSIRKWWAALPNNRRQLIREWFLRRRWHLAAGTGFAMVIVVLLLLTHLDESPVTGRIRLLVFSREKYMELATLTSEAYMKEFAEHLLPVTDPRHQMVEQLVQLLAQRNKDIPDVSEVPWSVHVVDAPNVNAFVLPNGKVFMFTGMLDAVADIDQLIIVLGHEMAHAILDHTAEKASLSHVVDLLSLILVTAIWAMCPGDSLAVLGQWAKDKITELMFSRPYSRKLEAEADQVGLLLAAKACADVRAGPVFWMQLELINRLTGESTLPEWLSTHPSHRNRSGQLDRLIPEALELRESCVCPALSPTDPRVVFLETVQILLEKTKDQVGGGPEREHEHHPTSLPTGLPAASVAQTALSSSSNGDQLSKGRVPTVAAPIPLVAAGERSQHLQQNTNCQES